MGSKARSKLGKRNLSAKGAASPATSHGPDRSAKEQDDTVRLWRKAFGLAPGITPDEALEAMHWIRQCLGLVAGIVFGALQVTGIKGISTFMMVCILAPNAYFQNYLHIDEDDVSKAGSLKTEGMFSSFVLFLLFWILFYTTFS